MSADLALLDVLEPAAALNKSRGDDSGEIALAAYQVPDKPLVVLQPTGRWAALESAGPLGVSRVALLPHLARRQGPLQADGARGRLGDHSAAVRRC